MTSTTADETFKIVLLGNSGVGKSNLIARYHTNDFSPDFMSTIGVEFITKKVIIDGSQVKLQIWDTAGQERYAAMMKTYYRKAKGAILVYDVSSQTSFDSLEIWRKNLEANADPNCIAIVAGNKCDIDECVSIESAKSYADSMNMGFMLTSAKTSKNVDNLFEDVARRILRIRKTDGDAKKLQSGNTINLKAPMLREKKENQECCKS